MQERTFHDVWSATVNPDDDLAGWFSEVIAVLDSLAKGVWPPFRSAPPAREPAFLTQPDGYELAVFEMRDPVAGTGWELALSRFPMNLATLSDADRGYLWTLKARASGLPGGRSVQAYGSGTGILQLELRAGPYELRRVEQVARDLLPN